MENRQAKAAMEKKHLLSSKMQSLTKLGLLKSLGKILRAYSLYNYIIINCSQVPINKAMTHDSYDSYDSD